MRLLLTCTLLLGLTACGGGGSSSSDDNTATTDLCQRTDVNSQVFCALQQDYLWYKDLPASINPDNYSTPQALLDAVKAPQDRFSYITTRQEYEDRFVNATYYGYGFSSIRVDDDTALQIAFVYDDGSAAQNGLRRGDKIIEIEGISVAEWLSRLDAGTATNEDIYGPNQAGVMREFIWTKPDNTRFSANFVKNDVTTNTVLHSSVVVDGSTRIGYLVFNSFIEISATELDQAFSEFAAQGVNELVLDLRYNGGGYIRVANQLSTQIAHSRVRNQVFIKYLHNDKNSADNTTVLFSLRQGQASLDLDRLFVLATAGTCSASEMVINSLSPFIEVVQIGETTCGKPVGMQTVFINTYALSAINFQTVNALDQGDYFDGLQPNCPVTAAIAGDWGVATDPLYAEALHYINNNSCSDVAVSAASVERKVTRPQLAAPWMLNNEQ